MDQAKQAIMAAYCKRHCCVGMGGPALAARDALAEAAAECSDGLMWAQAARLRAWADVLLDAAKRLEKGPGP